MAETACETSADEAATEAIGERLGRRLAPDGTLLLHGELGAGKTVLVKGIARALGVARGEVQSPSYTLIHEHRGSRGRLVHVDLYRLERSELAGLGLDELLAGPGVKAVEWAERLALPPSGAVEVEIRAGAGGTREVRVRPGEALFPKETQGDAR